MVNESWAKAVIADDVLFVKELAKEKRILFVRTAVIQRKLCWFADAGSARI